ncbi:MAG: RagB/SusD family nutrient uptake outer membrane protein, partial [Alistipes dispar]
MKQIIRTTVTLLFVSAGISFVGSCSLDEQPSSFIESSAYYQTAQQCIAGLNSCYIPLKTIYNYTFLIAVEGVTDLMYIKSGTLDAQLDISPAVPRLGSTMWRQGYLGIMYSNAVIAGIRRSPLSEEEQAPLLAEGIVMRAFYYWLLTSFFGDVPFYTQDVANEQIRT